MGGCCGGCSGVRNPWGGCAARHPRWPIRRELQRLAARPAAAVPSRAYARPRSAEKDQDQRVEIAGFRFRKAANSSNAVRGLAEFPANRGFFAIQQGILFVRK